jgi:hypothetical protein
MAERLTLLHRMLEVMVSNLGSDTGYTDGAFSWFSSVYSDEFQDITLQI